MSHEPPSRYQLFEIAMDSNGTWWVYYVGDVPEQGGIRFGHGSVGFSSPENALTFIGHMITTYLPEYQARVARKGAPK